MHDVSMRKLFPFRDQIVSGSGTKGSRNGNCRVSFLDILVVWKKIHEAEIPVQLSGRLTARGDCIPPAAPPLGYAPCTDGCRIIREMGSILSARKNPFIRYTASPFWERRSPVHAGWARWGRFISLNGK